MKIPFEERLAKLENEYEALVTSPNEMSEQGNGVVTRFRNPVLTRAHIPIFWRFDLNPDTNPFLMERFGINAVFNAGAIKWKGKYLLIARVEGSDRKSFFAVAESDNGIDNFRFWDYPVNIPLHKEGDVNIYDMRVTVHEDGWIYGVFCTEKKDISMPVSDTTSAIAQSAIARTKDLKHWERLNDLQTNSLQQRNVVLHPEFCDGKYAFYTRPQDSFINTGNGAGIGFGLSVSITQAKIEEEKIIDPKRYHTISEAKNGLGPPPIKTSYGWLHLAHGVRNTAAGLRYVLYLFMTDLHDLTKVIHKPGGYFLAPEGEERTGDVSNVVFSNGWIADDDGTVYIYYASSDTRMHVAASTIDKLVDYVMHTPEDGLHVSASVNTLLYIIHNNREYAGHVPVNIL